MSRIYNAPLREFAEKVRGMSKVDFVSAYATPVLVIERSRETDDSSQYHTIGVSKGPGADKELDAQLAETQAIELKALEEGLKFVTSVEKSGRNAFKDRVTIGRSVNNDIVINSGAVSKFHAFITHDAARDVYSIRDVGSTNGTSMQGKPMQPNTLTDLFSGTSMSFGQSVAATFFLPAEFFDFIDVINRSDVD
jgi:hypothetical protein